MHIDPSKLRGINIFWKLFEKSDNRSEELNGMINSFLSQIYSSTSSVIKEKIGFVKESVSRLQNFLLSPDESTASKNQIVKSTMTMLNQSFKDYETSGTAMVRVHQSIDKTPKTIKNIIFSSYIVNDDNHPKHMMVNVDESMTVWELMDFVSKKFNLSPLNMRFYRCSNQYKPDITPLMYGMTLQEAQFEDNEELNVMRALHNFEKVPLLNPHTLVLVPEAAAIFSSWFDVFAKPREEYEDADRLTEP